MTDAFSPGGDPPNIFSQSATRDYIVGPTLQLRLPLGLSLDAKGLSEMEEELVKAALDERLMLAGKEPVFRQQED